MTNKARPAVAWSNGQDSGRCWPPFVPATLAPSSLWKSPDWRVTTSIGIIDLCGLTETLIIDDGSTDRTLEVAKEIGVNHIVKLPVHMGLAEAAVNSGSFDFGIPKAAQ